MSFISNWPEKLLHIIDIGYVLSSNDQVVDIYYDEYLSSGVIMDEQGIVELRHFEADSLKILGYLQVPSSRCLLEAVEMLSESAYCLQVCG